MCGFAMYDIPNVEVIGYDVVSNRPKVAAYRAPGAPISSFAVESAMDDLARKLGKDPIALREQNGARNGTKTHYGPTHQNIGYLATLEAAKIQRALEVAVEAGPGARHRHRVLVQHRRRILRVRARGRGRLGLGGVGQPRHRRIARLDRHDGGRGAADPGRTCAHDRRRYQLDRLHPCHRRLAASPSRPAWRRRRQPRRSWSS